MWLQTKLLKRKCQIGRRSCVILTFVFRHPCKGHLTGKWNGQQNNKTTENFTKRGSFPSTIVTFFRFAVYNFEKFYNCNAFLQTLNLSFIDSIFFLLSTKRNLYGVVWCPTECGVSIHSIIGWRSETSWSMNWFSIYACVSPIHLIIIIWNC